MELNLGGIHMSKSYAINEWYIAGLGGESISIHVSTACGYYKILSVTEEYAPFFSNLWNYTNFTNHFARCLLQQDKESFNDVICSFQVIIKEKK
jgi:Cytosine specific DNA methyltransferase replication foci domain